MSIMTDMQIIFVVFLIITFGAPVLIVMLMKKARINKKVTQNTENQKKYRSTPFFRLKRWLG